MFNQILKLKHWVFFVLVYGLPTMIQIINMQGFTNQYKDALDGDILDTQSVEAIFISMFDAMFFLMPLVIGIPLVVMFVWLLSVGIGLQKKIPAALQKNPLFFVLANILGGVSILFAVFKMIDFFSSFMYTIIKDAENTNIESLMPSFSSLAILPALFLAAFISYIYVYYFAAKTIKTAETQKASKFGDFISEFFLIVFFPVGVWVLQPRINKIIEADENAYMNDKGEKVTEIDEML